MIFSDFPTLVQRLLYTDGIDTMPKLVDKVGEVGLHEVMRKYRITYALPRSLLVEMAEKNYAFLKEHPWYDLITAYESQCTKFISAEEYRVDGHTVTNLVGVPLYADGNTVYYFGIDGWLESTEVIFNTGEIVCKSDVLKTAGISTEITHELVLPRIVRVGDTYVDPALIPQAFAELKVRYDEHHTMYIGEYISMYNYLYTYNFMTYEDYVTDKEISLLSDVMSGTLMSSVKPKESLRAGCEILYKRDIITQDWVIGVDNISEKEVKYLTIKMLADSLQLPYTWKREEGIVDLCDLHTVAMYDSSTCLLTITMWR